MSYLCLVGSFLNSTTTTQPDPTRLVCDPIKNPYMSRLNWPGLWPKKAGKVADQTRQVGDRVADPGHHQVWSVCSSGI